MSFRKKLIITALIVLAFLAGYLLSIVGSRRMATASPKTKISFGAEKPAAPSAEMTVPQAAPAAKMTVVHALENVAQIEMATFMPKIKLALHRQRRPGQFSFRFFRHRTFRITEGTGHKFRFCFPY